AGGPVAIFFDLLQSLEDRVVIGDAVGIVVGAIGKPLKLPPLRSFEVRRMLGQFGADRLLLLRGKALYQSDNMQRRRAHKTKLTAMNRRVQGFATFLQQFSFW